MSFGKDSGAQTAAAGTDAATEELRRQFNITRKDILPFVEAGKAQIPALEAGATVGGLEDILAQIFDTDIFGSLVEERGRAVEGQLAAGGLTRSGTALTEAARVPTDIGLALEQLLSGRQQSIAGQGLTAGVNLGGIGSQTSSQIASLTQQGGFQQGQAEAAGSQNFLNTAATVAAIFFSDPSLKENVEEIGELHGLKVYQWDWIEKAKDTMIEKCSTIGFMADEVKKIFPQFVHEFCGLMVIDYDSLLSEMEAA